MIKLSLKICDCWVSLEADRFEIVVVESQKSNPSAGTFMAYNLFPSTNCISSISFCCSLLFVSDILDENGSPYKVETVYV